jgi:hypothetical protein
VPPTPRPGTRRTIFIHRGAAARRPLAYFVVNPDFFAF